MKRVHRLAARRAIIWLVAAFVGLQIAMNLFVEMIRPDFVDPDYGFRYHQLRSQLRQNPDRPLVLMLGSSRTQMGFTPAQIANDEAIIFNFGLPGLGPIGEWFTLNRLLASGVRPQHVLLEVLPPALNSEGHVEHFWRMDRAIWCDLKTLASLSESPTTVYADWFHHRAAVCYNARQGILNRIAPGFVPSSQQWRQSHHRTDVHGWYAFPWPDVDEAFRQRATTTAIESYQSTSLRQFFISPVARWAYRSMLERLRDEGVRVTVVVMPEGSAFRAAYPPGAWEEIEAFLAEISGEFAVPLVNAREWLADEHFWDGHHLLPSGAIRFTDRLAAEVLTPVMIARP